MYAMIHNRRMVIEMRLITLSLFSHNAQGYGCKVCLCFRCGWSSCY